MFNVPLPFLAGLIFVIALYHSLKGVEAPGSRRYYVAFLTVYAAQGLIVGLHFGYGVAALRLVQPVTASLLPPLAYLAFRSLTSLRLARPLRHLLAPFVVLIAVLTAPYLIDPLLLAIFLAYAAALWRLTRTGGDEVMAEASLQRMRPASRAARLTAGLMLFFALSDAALSIYTALAGTQDVSLMVGAANIITIVVVVAYSLLPPTASDPPAENRPRQAEGEDAAIVARVTAALDDGDLFRDENLSLARLARKAQLPARDLSAAINRSTGLNVSQFVNNRRIDEACRLLRETGGPVTKIMFDCGFSTKSNFNREFRRVAGMSPAQYRAQARQGTKGRSGKTRT